jgi:hypothetical protein
MILTYQIQTIVASVARHMAVTAVAMLFPKRCVGCGDEGSFLCQRCSEELPTQESPSLAGC